ncbi:protein IcmL-like protein [Legionella lansingensis]|uniref:IcmL-like protein n=1 Tax=Legionella lansingensis TaxID=45067 RepID=A0A0W0VY72_9GAMM|nr:DotI/IcmL family type IV secretion protein [Legionella lansingensis]KTD24986.1 IcmL-like protein [Legionella lansingensis]SNV48300.1 protein IcmL-like protein [Legionella lansingensis]
MKKEFCGVLLSLICTQLQALQAPDAPQNAQATQHLLSQFQKPTDIHCGYSIPAETKRINQAFVLNWVEHAVSQSFDFNFESIDAQLQALEPCYTEKGWSEFKTALQRSGNIEAIRNQKLIMNSRIDGQAQLIESNSDSFWKVTLPLNVVYQNDEKRITHFLNVYVTIGRKIRGELAIMQMIATPRMPPLSQKPGSIEETARSIYIIMAHKNTETFDTAQTKIITPLFTSLFPPQTRISSSQVKPTTGQPRQQTDLRKGQQTKIAREVPHIDQLRPYQFSSIAKITQIPITKPPTKAPSATAKMDQILNWQNDVIARSFDLTPEFLDTTMQTLQSWYAEKKLFELNVTVKKSSNIAANKTPKLMTNHSMNRQLSHSDSNDRQWNISLPIKIAYQNDWGQATPLLDVNFTVGWKITGDLTKILTTSGIAFMPAKIARASLSGANIISSQTVQRVDLAPQISSPMTQQVQSSAPQQTPQILQDTPANQMLVSKQLAEAETINCDYKIPADITNIDPALVLSWAQYAVTQSFDFNHAFIDAQLQKLQSCYTEEGWAEFKAALDQSGNIDAIKTLNLIMSSQMAGQAQLIESNNNQWNITLPLKVIYQTDKEKVSQLFNINLTVGRKITGDLGIMHIIATLGAASVPSELPHS